MFRKLIPTFALATAMVAICFVSAEQADAQCYGEGRGVSVGFVSGGFGGGGFGGFNNGFNSGFGGFNSGFGGSSFYRPSYGGFNSFNSFNSFGGRGFGGGFSSYRPSYSYSRSSCGRY